MYGIAAPHDEHSIRYLRGLSSLACAGTVAANDNLGSAIAKSEKWRQPNTAARRRANSAQHELLK